MKWSERVEPVRLVDFAKAKPEPRKSAFVTKSNFESLSQARAEQPSAEELYQRGLAEGEQRGRDAALKELAPALARFEELARSLSTARAERIGAAEQDLLDVASEIARRILHGELRQESDAVLRMARSAIDEAKGAEGELVLRAAPRDVELLRAHLHELELDLAEHQLKLAADPHVTPGGVVLETAGRCYEGRPERVLEAAVQCAKEGPR
jgi:flagellar biosynthesis/type III secretory pathway protein FliH